MRGTAKRAIPSLLVVAFVLSTATPPSTADGGLPGCGLEVLPCEIGPGTHEGALEPFLNERDHYAFTPPDDPAAIQIEVISDSEAIEAVLRDPQGRVRGQEDTWGFPPFEVGAVAQPAGTWTLEIGYRYLLGGGGSSEKADYTFTLEWDHHEHVEEFDLEVHDAPSIAFDLDDRAHVEVLHEAASDSRSSVVYRSIVQVRSEQSGHRHTYTYRGSSGTSTHEVNLWGEVSAELQANGPAFSTQYHALDHRHDHVGPAIVDIAFSTSRGIETSTAWVAYDGNPPSITQHQGEAFYYSVQDMEGGEGAAAAGLVHAEGLWSEQTFVGTGPGSSEISVDADDTYAHLDPVTATVTTPSGETHDVSGERMRFWNPESGTWRIDLHHIDGWEGDRIRFYGWSFPLTPW